MTAYWSNKHLPKEMKKKISLSKRGTIPVNKGVKVSKELRSKLSLINAHRKGGVPKGFILLRDDYTCQICGLRDREVVEVDHILPKSSGGTNDISNLMTLCANCHRKKTNREHKLRFKGINVRKFWSSSTPS